jgi:hypothetical protein
VRSLLFRYGVAIGVVLAFATPVALAASTPAGPTLIPPVVSVQPSPTVQGFTSGPNLIPPLTSPGQ